MHFFGASSRNLVKSRFQSPIGLRFLPVLLLAYPQVGPGDTFTYLDKDQNSVKVEAGLYGSGKGLHALLLANGQIRILPQAAVQKREASAGPEPLSPKAIIQELENKFGKERFRGHSDPPFVIGLVLAAPLPKNAESRSRAALKKAARFMRNVERVFKAFAKRMRIQIQPPTHPLVLLVFETDQAFNQYIGEVKTGRGVSSQNLAGFYSSIINWLAVRMTECLTFETPLHEAIHQQVYNQHVFKRLAPVPAWFDEGIATGFEGNGERISVGPHKISSRYSRMAKQATTIDWEKVVAEDSAFRGDVLAGEAYAHAWSLHWLLVSKYKDEYIEYLKMLGQKEPLQEQDARQRVSEFEKIFGKSVSELEAEFPRVLRAGSKRQKLVKEKKRPPGELTVQSNLAEVKILGLHSRGELQAKGKIRNISAIRPMSFHIVFSTNAGMYCQWYVPNLAINRSMTLETKIAENRMRNAPGDASNSFRIRVDAAAPDSEDAAEWKDGNLPVPVFDGF